jgi:hypothetical protein
MRPERACGRGRLIRWNSSFLGGGVYKHVYKRKIKKPFIIGSGIKNRTLIVPVCINHSESRLMYGKYLPCRMVHGRWNSAFDFFFLLVIKGRA